MTSVSVRDVPLSREAPRVMRSAPAAVRSMFLSFLQDAASRVSRVIVIAVTVLFMVFNLIIVITLLPAVTGMVVFFASRSRTPTLCKP